MNMLGLNPNEQEVIDIPNHVARLQKLFSNAATYVAMTCSGTTWSTSPTFARSCWTGCATQQRRRCLLVTCPTRSPSSRKNRNLVKGLRRRRRAQLPAHHLQGSSNIVFNILQATDQIAAHVRNRALSDGIPSQEIQTRETFSFQGGQICCLPIPIFSPQEDFFFIMQNLPVHVPDEDIAEGSSSSTDHYGKLSKHSVVWFLSSLLKIFLIWHVVGLAQMYRVWAW